MMPNTDERRAKKIAYDEIIGTMDTIYENAVKQFEQKWAKFLAEKSRTSKYPQTIADEFIRRWNEL